MASVLFETQQRYPDSVLMRVVGRSMEPTLHDGDAALVDVTGNKPQDGDVIAVHIRGKGRIVGRFRSSGRRWWLDKDNRQFDRLPLRRRDFAVIGTVRCIVERPGAPFIEMPVTPSAGNSAALPDEQLLQRALFAVRRVKAIAAEYHETSDKPKPPIRSSRTS